ncbi:MAG TPA: Scr1 family TA system antitoxin-like transcriptional regulator [Pseudonocardiaceae bacterium]|jgi:hypothetical protein|nr:Scr1 family TA system antitoxin-like transcriptional regulator [Pseudonocardiaceae bacterium]
MAVPTGQGHPVVQTWQRPSGWFQQPGSRLPKQLRTLIDHEIKAVTISDVEVTGMRGLLQTGEYARGVISRVVNVPPEEVDDRVAARLARQSMFSRDRPPHAPSTFTIPPWQPSSMRIERIMMTAPEPDRIVWHTSSYSTGSGNCVEVVPLAGRRAGAGLQGPRRPRAGRPRCRRACPSCTPSPLTTPRAREDGVRSATRTIS